VTTITATSRIFGHPEERQTAHMLIAIKVLHTIVWGVLAGCILVLPILAARRRFGWAAILSVVILAECAVIAANHGRCPLTDVATRYTKDRTDNFDIYLPRGLARYNKTIFGSLFVVNELFALWYWRRSLRTGPSR
jgi:hypothetical protein